MSELISIDDAKKDLLACATYLAEKIGSSDGHAEAIKELLPYYLAKNDVDNAAELADAVEDPFVRDQSLVAVVDKCAEVGDDDYAFQLAEAIESHNLQGVARENIAKRKAINGEFEKAFEIAKDLEHSSDAYATIAKCQEKSAALQTIEQIEFPFTKVITLQEISLISNDLELLEKATAIAKEIEFEEERIRAYLSISFQYTEAKRNDKAIEVLDQARQYAETLDSIQKDSFFSQISQGFMRAGSVDLADRTLDLVSDKYEIAHALVGYSDEYWARDEKEDAHESLDEAYQILKSQKETETRNSKAKFNLLGLIAIRFASFEKFERGIEIANENLYDETRQNSLSQIAVICETKGKYDLAQQAINDIDDEGEKTLALIALSDVRRKSEDKESALLQLNEALFHLESIQQPTMKSVAYNRLAERFDILGDSEKARRLCGDNLQSISEILDESHRVSALAELANTFEALKCELTDEDKDILLTMIRKASW